MYNNRKDKSELERIIEEANRKNINIFSQKQLNNEKERILDEELKIIKEKIKNSNPKWKLEDFNEFFYEGYSKIKRQNTTMVKIFGRTEYKKLIKISKKLKSKDRNYLFELSTRNTFRYITFNKDLNLKKINDLIKAYIFYSNTKYDKRKIKFSYERLSIFQWITVIALTILIGITVLLLLCLILWGIIIIMNDTRNTPF